MIIECPQDGSPRGLCLAFFDIVDQILGTHYFEQFSRKSISVDELLVRMSKLAALLGLGVLVIDEIQRLSKSKGGGEEQIENFFVQLNNVFGVPVIQIGTPDALPIITRKLAYARKNTGQGSFIASNMQNDDEWHFLTKGILGYQWTWPPTKVTNILIDALYEVSQGIPDIAIKLFQIVQWQLIGSKNEEITPSVIKECAKWTLKLVNPALNALRSGDPSRLSEFSDAYVPRQQLDEYLRQARSRVRLSGTLATLKNLKQAELDASSADEEEHSLLFSIVTWLMDAGLRPEKAYDCASEALKRYPYDYDRSSLFLKRGKSTWIESSSRSQIRIRRNQIVTKKSKNYPPELLLTL